MPHPKRSSEIICLTILQPLKSLSKVLSYILENPQFDSKRSPSGIRKTERKTVVNSEVCKIRWRNPVARARGQFAKRLSEHIHEHRRVRLQLHDERQEGSNECPISVRVEVNSQMQS
ncbi:unnamed protein product [Polarella glacialis]|uniref:Uncharacterized protein n=1 Tax=Polarella glacialis TaxID=89957 RepID=A0A813ICE2_POLGL|nr:unnamed protein product [Polarella glacialis]